MRCSAVAAPEAPAATAHGPIIMNGQVLHSITEERLALVRSIGGYVADQVRRSAAQGQCYTAACGCAPAQQRQLWRSSLRHHAVHLHACIRHTAQINNDVCMVCEPTCAGCFHPACLCCCTFNSIWAQHYQLPRLRPVSLIHPFTARLQVQPLLKPVDKCWQPADFLPASEDPDFMDQVRPPAAGRQARSAGRRAFRQTGRQGSPA
jgi:hypothetical protein